MLNQTPGKESRVIRAAEWELIKEFFGENPEDELHTPDVQELLKAYEQVAPSLRHVAIQQIRALIAAKS
jgi:hypothetical protein